MLVIAYFIPISFLLQFRKPRLAHQCHYTRLIQRITNKNDAQMKCKQTNKTNERTNKQHKYTHTQPHSLTHSLTHTTRRARLKNWRRSVCRQTAHKTKKKQNKTKNRRGKTTQVYAFIKICVSFPFVFSIRILCLFIPISVDDLYAATRAHRPQRCVTIAIAIAPEYPQSHTESTHTNDVKLKGSADGLCVLRYL